MDDMGAREIGTQTMEASRVKRDFEEILDEVSREQTRVLVEEQGRPVAGIVSPHDMARLNQLDAAWDDDWRVFDEIHARNRDRSSEEVTGAQRKSSVMLVLR